MKKTLLLMILLLVAPLSWSESIDLIVMVDTSESMFHVFPDLVDYLLTDLLTNHLRFGDTFHLLTFADRPEVKIASSIDSEQSIEQVLRRLLLLKPLGHYTDLVSALRFLSAYVHELPERNRKTILLLTDGIHDPPPDSPFRLDPEEVRRQLFQTAEEIARAGWKVHILRLPPEGEQGTGLGLTDLTASGAGAGAEGARVEGTGAEGSGAETRPGSSAAATSGQQGAQEGASAAAGKTGGSGVSGGLSPAAQSSGAGRPGAPGGVSATSGAQAGPSTAGTPSPSPDYVSEIARVLRAPVAELGSGQTDLPGSVGFPTIRFPTGTIRGGRRLSVVFGVDSAAPEAIYLELDGVLLQDGSNILQESAAVIIPPGSQRDLTATIVLPEGTQPGRQSLQVELTFSSGMRASPSRGELTIDYTGRPGIAAGAFGRARSGGAALLFVLLGIVGIALVALAAYGLRSRLDLGSLTRRAGYREGRYARERAEGYPLIEMVVTMQNHRIGHRNVHALRPGAPRSVGGGRSAYLVYFVPVPPSIAYVSFDGRTYTFVPVRPELFPEVSGQVADCLGKEIPAVSPKGYRFAIVFRPYRSPLEELNDLLRSVRVESTKEG